VNQLVTINLYIKMQGATIKIKENNFKRFSFHDWHLFGYIYYLISLI